MTQEQYYLNKIGKGCYKLPERPKPLELETNYLPGCINLKPTHSDYLIQLNMLSEFSTPEQLAEARSNLGITPLLEELNRQLDERVLTTQRAVVEQTLTDNENRVLSSHGLYLILQQYYTKKDLDSLITKINELIANLIIVDNELSNESTNPVLNKVLTDAINGIYEVIVNRIINPRKKDDGMGYNSYISVREELEAKVNLTELENYYNKEQVDIIKQNLQSQINEAKNISNTVIELVQTTEYLERLKSIIFNDLTELIPTKVSHLENDSQYVTSSEVSSEVSSAVNTAVSSLVNGAPEALDTLKEIADKLGDNDDAVAGLINQITEETSRAKSTENTLSTALNNEISRAKAAEKANSDNIDTLNTTLNQEISRAQRVEANKANISDLDEKANISDLATVATSGDYKDLKNVPVIEANPGNREYVEIAGIKWATMNIGATSETDYGLYFQWGDTQGYTASQVGSGEGQKYFGWTDYKYGNGTSSPGATGMTKYNSTDGKTVLDLEDDAARANWGGSWRMPTTEELQALGNAVNSVWTENYNGSGINGLLCTDKTDNSKTLFFPAAGYARSGSMYGVGDEGRVWSSSLFIGSVSSAWDLYFFNGGTRWGLDVRRYFGLSVRGVLDTTPINKLHKVAESGNYNDLENTPTDISHFNNDANYVTEEELDNTEEVVAAALNDLNTNKADKTEVFPVKATYEEMVEMRTQGKLIPGQYYQITDYVTTVNGATITNARSAGHQFDILVRADSVSTLNDQAWAVRHDGDTYFKDARLEAWELKYRLDNVQWSKQAGTYVTDEDNGYSFLLIGDITLSGHTYKLLQGFGMYVENWSDYALMETVAEGEQIICYYGDPEDFDPKEPEVVGTANGVEEVTETGKGTIVYMKDEHGNECPYDFKNVQFKRYMTTDSVSGRDGLGGKYMVADPNNCPQGLSVEDTEDFIWAYTFSSDNSGGEQTDYSLTSAHWVHDNTMKPYGTELNNNVMFGDGNYSNSFGFNCYNNSWGNGCSSNSWGNQCRYNSWGNNNYYNSWGNDCYYNSWGNWNQNNSWGNSNQNNSWGNDCNNNSWGNYCSRNSWGNQCRYNSWGNNCNNNSLGNVCQNNSWGNDCNNNSLGNVCQYNSWGNNCYKNSWGNKVTQSTLFEGVQYTQITTENVKNVQVLNGVAGTSSSLLTLTFAANKTYTQVAAKTSAGALKIYVPGDFQTKSELDNNYVNESLLWTGTQADYDTIPKSDTTIYIITES